LTDLPTSNVTSQAIASRAGINVSFPRKQASADQAKTPARKSMDAIKTLAAAVRPSVNESGEVNGISKPPVIAMPRTDSVTASDSASEPVQASAHQGAVARIVMGQGNQPATIPVAQPPIVRPGTGVDVMPSSRRSRVAKSPTAPSLVRQVGYEQSVTPPNAR
jgi:hypothetical protein